MTSWTVERTARKAYDCDAGGCPSPYRRIQPGDPYYVITATPNHEDLGNQGWLRARRCSPCNDARQPRGTQPL